MIRHVLTGELGAALTARQAAFALSGSAEEWVLPAGTHVLPAGVELGLEGRELAVSGGSHTLLRFESGGLALRGERVRVANLRVQALDLGQGPAALSVRASVARVSGVQVSGEGEDATGLEVVGLDEAVLSDCSASQVQGSGWATGIVAIAPALGVVSVRASEVRGAQGCEGILLLSPGQGDLLALDLSVTGVGASGGACSGLAVFAGGPARVRGFSIEGVSGGHAHGLALVARRSLELGSGRVTLVRGTSPGAAGMRVLAMGADAAASLHDLTVEAVGGVAPASDARPRPELAAWGEQVARALDSPNLGRAGLPPFPEGAARSEVVGLHVAALIDALAWVQLEQPRSLELEDVVLRRIGGTALQVEAGLRPAELRRIEAWTSARAGWLQAENLLLAEATLHRHGERLLLGPGNVRVLDSLFSGTPGGAAPALDPEADLVQVAGAFASDAAPPWRTLAELPYRDPGPPALPDADGSIPAATSVDLALRPEAAALHAAAVPVDGSGATPFVGAHPPDAPAPCHLDDPEPRAWRPAAAQWPSDPVVDYRARDARSLLSVMLERARVTLLPWTEGDPSDLTQMLFELLAERLDQLAYQQERVVAEGFLERARLRRSVEDHARPLDYRPDPGLSASVMLRFELQAPPADARLVEIPAGTLVGNEQPEERAVTFATEAPLPHLPELSEMRLAADVGVGATSARLSGRFERLEVGRWLVLSRGPALPGLVVRVTSLRLETDTTWIGWDPRRPAEQLYPAQDPGRAVVYGNVVPAHHGLPIELGNPAGPADALDRALARHRELARFSIDGSQTRELELSLRPSVQASGYPFPGERRQGRRLLRVAVDGDPWTEVDDLSNHGPDDEVYVLRSGSRGLPVLRFGDGVNGAALPARQVEIDVELTAGGGAEGNVGARTLNRLIRFGRSTDGLAPESLISAPPGPARDDQLRGLFRVSNPLPALGGRDREPLESIRYRAPLGVRDALSAIVPADYERLLLGLPWVAGARARAVEAGLRRLIQVTVLLRDQDSLPPPELLRRWALVRQRLEEIRLLGFDVEAVPPLWVPLDLDLVVDAAPHAEPGRLRADVIEAVAGNGGLLDPDTTGLGGDLRLSDLYQAVQRVDGVQGVRVTRFRRLEPGAREQLPDGVIPVGEHEVATVGGPRRPALGLLTVSVCGGLA